MTVLDVFRKPGTRSGSRTTTSVEGQETWIVVTDDPDDDDVVILDQFVDPGSTFMGRRIESVSAEEVGDDGYQWEVDVKYSAEAIDNPLLEPIKISMNQQQVQTPTEFDKDGEPILNAAGDPFQEIVFIEDAEDTIQISKNYAAIPYAAGKTAKKKLNSETFLTVFAPGEVRYKGMSATPQEHESLGTYYTVTIEFAIAENWTRKILNQGFRELDDDDELVNVKIKGEPASQPVLLDAAGKQLASGGTPVDLDFDLYESVNFTTLFGF